MLADVEKVKKQFTNVFFIFEFLLQSGNVSIWKHWCISKPFSARKIVFCISNQWFSLVSHSKLNKNGHMEDFLYF